MEHSRYAICRGATKWARLLYEGALPVGTPTSNKPYRIAIDEVRAGLVRFTLVPPGRRFVSNAATVSPEPQPKPNLLPNPEPQKSQPDL